MSSLLPLMNWVDFVFNSLLYDSHSGYELVQHDGN